jgi:hypothetical protein
MTDFEGQVLADLSVLKSQMKQVMGIGQIGRLGQLEDRMQDHEKAVQRMKESWVRSAVCSPSSTSPSTSSWAGTNHMFSQPEDLEEIYGISTAVPEEHRATA